MSLICSVFTNLMLIFDTHTMEYKEKFLFVVGKIEIEEVKLDIFKYS